MDRRNILWCLALFLLAVALVSPVLEMGLNDDWSYAHIAREFASTGHVAYNGWATPMLLAQTVWASLFFRLFGFSFTAARLSTVVLGALMVPLLYKSGRISGLAPSFAAFLTLLTVLSPLVMPVTVSFMSDAPSLFLFVLCFYAGVRSAKAGGSTACLGWAALLAGAGVLSALNRQIYWVAPLALLPTLGWMRRRDRTELAGLSAFWAAALLTGAWCSWWFSGKPYTTPEHPLNYWMHTGIRQLAARSLNVAADLGITLGLILLPVLIGFAVPGFKALSRKFAVMTLVLVLAGGLFFSARRHHPMPSTGNILTEYGIFRPNLVAIGRRPVILAPAVRDLLTVAIFLSVAGCFATLWKGGPGAAASLMRDEWAAPALLLGGVFSAVYLSGVLFHSAHEAAYDRYLIPLLPLAALPLLRWHQTHVGARVSLASWGMLALFSLYGVATTHDALAEARARLTAAQAIERAGIPRSEIVAGFDYDGWTQLEAAGYLNDGRIENPRDAYRPVNCGGSGEGPIPKDAQVWYLRRMPSIRARYFVRLSRSGELEDSPYSPVGYTTWLPPSRRQAVTQVVPGGAYAGCR